MQIPSQLTFDIFPFTELKNSLKREQNMICTLEHLLLKSCRQFTQIGKSQHNMIGYEPI